MTDRLQLSELRTMADFVRELRTLIWEAESNFGEITDEALARWEALDENIEVKAQNTVKFIQELEASANMFAARAKGLTEHAKHLKNTAEGLRRSMIYFLDKSGKRKCPTPLFPKLSVRQNSLSVFVTDEGALFSKKFLYTQKGYLERQDPKIRKSQIKEALLAGEVIDGVTLGRKEKLYW